MHPLSSKLVTLLLLLALPTLTVGVTLSDAEHVYLAHKKSIKMCVDPDWMPLEQIRGGKHIGIAADYITLFEKQLGVPIELYPSKNWNESIKFAKKRQCDIFSLAMATPERQKYMNFTSPYLSVPLVLATDFNKPYITDIAAVQEKKMGIVSGYAFADLLRDKYPHMQIVEVESVEDGLYRVVSGELYGVIGTLVTIGYAIQSDFINSIKITGKFDSNWELGVGVRNDAPLLLSAFEKAISATDHQQNQQIINRWLSVRMDDGIDYQFILKIFAITLLIVLAFLYHYFKLRLSQDRLAELVNQKTADLQAAKNAAEDANFSKSHFLANMSHELRTPMHAILSFAHMGEKKTTSATPEQLELYFNNIAVSGKRLLTLLNDLLDLSKLESRKSYFKLHGNDLRSIINIAKIEFDDLLNKKELKLLVIDSNTETSAWFDADKMLQVIRNLLSNAIKFSHPEGTITISFELDEMEDTLSMLIADEGIGIPADELSLVFDKFIQSSKTDSGAGGTGLGLAICKEILKIHGGTIQALNSSTDGATFKFTLPRSDPQAAAHT